VNLAVVAITETGAALARRLTRLWPGARIYGLKGRVSQADETFARMSELAPHLFDTGFGIIGVCASGILIRALARDLADKRTEPPVIAVAEDGSAVVPLLGGHRGANQIAQEIAQELGIDAAITTAGELRLGLALDAPPPGWRIATPERVKSLAAALLADEPVTLRVDAGSAAWLSQSSIRFAEAADRAIWVTDRVRHDAEALVYHPPVLAVGVGCERGTPPAEIADLVRDTIDGHGLAPGAIALIASIDLKMDEPAVHALGETLGVPARFFSAAALEAETPRLANPSDLVFRETGCHGVAEGAALAAAGPDAVLLVAKTKSRRATCAVAQAPTDIDPGKLGQARGRLMVVGIGPGQASWRTPEVSAALADADDVVGYGLYLDMLGDAIAGKPRHATDLGAEEDRVARALDLAALGRQVALVSSGDAGIYALATLVFELVERMNRPDWNRIAIDVMPGVSAVQAAAARVGAPLGHDFCAISLSDLLTPWPDIVRRLEAAAAADFVIALYNPASLRRRRQLDEALAILRQARPTETPVVLARNLGRPGETVEIKTLAEVSGDAVDMLTLVLIGSSRTRRIDHGGQQRVFTPRGYAGKSTPARTGSCS